MTIVVCMLGKSDYSITQQITSWLRFGVNMRENYLNFHDIVLLVSAIECGMLAAVVKMIPGQVLLTRHWLAAFFVVMAVALGSNMALWKVELTAVLAGGVSLVLLLMVSSSLMKGPLLYFYLRTLCSRSDAHNQSGARLLDHLAYFIPVALAVVTIYVFDIGVEDWSSARQLTDLKGYFVYAIWLSIKIVPVIFVVAAARLMFGQKDSIAGADAPESGEVAFSKVVFYCFSAHWLWLFAAYMLSFYLPQNVNVALGIAGNYLMFILLKVIFVMGAVAVLRTFKNAKKLERNKISDQQNKINKIESAINDRKLHLDKTINSERFSERIDLSAREVSVLIQLHYKCNFVDFINHHRVEEAKKSLSATACSKESIKSIALRSGFNSISSFNRIFTKHTQMTPSEYRAKSMAGASSVSGIT